MSRFWGKGKEKVTEIGNIERGVGFCGEISDFSFGAPYKTLTYKSLKRRRNS